MRWGLMFLLCIGCGRVGFDAVATNDASLDAPFATGPFGTPAPETVLNSPQAEDDVSLTADQLEIYFMSDRSGGDLVYRSVRASTSESWPAPSEVVGLPTLVNNPRISADGLTLYFASDVTSGAGMTDVYFVTRPDRGAAWSASQPIAGINSAGDEFEPWVVRDGRVLYLSLTTMTGASSAIARAERASTADPFGAPVVLDSVDSSAYDGTAWVDEAELVLVFHSDRGANGIRDLYISTRATTAEPFPPPVPMTDVNTTSNSDADAWLSPDGRVLYFSSTRGGTEDIYTATR